MKRSPLALLLAAALVASLASSAALAQPKGAKTEKKAVAKPEPTRKGEAGKQAAAVPAGAPSWYAQRVTRGDTGLIVASLWSKGRKLRADAVLAGVPITQLVNGEFYYVIDGARGVAIAVRRSTAALQADLSRAGVRPFGHEGTDLVAKGAELVREEEIAGRPCQVYRLTDGYGRHEIWVTKDKTALPLRIDSSDRASGVRVVTDYVDWLSQLELPEAFFEPDPRLQIERLEYDEYMQRASQGPLGPAPVLFSDLLHGR